MPAPTLYRLPGKIWKVLTAHNGLAVELKSTETQQTGYAWLQNGQYTLLPLEDYWRGLKAVGHSMLFTHGFAKPSTPVQEGLRAYTLKGELLWEQTLWRLIYLTAQGLIVQEVNTGEQQHVSASGKPLLEKPKPYPYAEQLFPGVGVYTDEIWPDMVAKAPFSFEPQLQLEFLKVNALAVWGGLALVAKDRFTYHISIPQLNYTDTLYTAREKVTVDSFFVWNSQLIYIKDEDKLISLPLE